MILDVTTPHHKSSTALSSPIRRSSSEEGNGSLNKKKQQRTNGSTKEDNTTVTATADDDNGNSSDSSCASSSSAASAASSALFAYRDEQNNKRLTSSTADSVSSSSTASTSVCRHNPPMLTLQRKFGYHPDKNNKSNGINEHDDKTELKMSESSLENNDDIGSPCPKERPTKQSTLSPSPIKTSPHRLGKNRVFPTSPRRIVVGSSPLLPTITTTTTSGVMASKPTLQSYFELHDANENKGGGSDQQQKDNCGGNKCVPTLSLLSSPQHTNNSMIADDDDNIPPGVKDITFDPRDELQRHSSVLSLGESIHPDELQARGIRPIIAFSSEEGDNNNNNNIPSLSCHFKKQQQQQDRGNRPSLERRVSHLTLGNESYIMDLAVQKQRREKERHEEALEETLEKVQDIVNSMEPSKRPNPDSEEYAVLFLRVLPQVKASLQRRYEEHDKQQDARLNEALMDELVQRERKEGNDTGGVTILERSVCSGLLADISEDIGSNNSGSETSQSNNSSIAVGMMHTQVKVEGVNVELSSSDSKPPKTTLLRPKIVINGVDRHPKPSNTKVYDRATKHRACIKIQALYRRYMIRSVFAPLMEGVHAHARAQAQKKASITLQACYRRYSTRNLYLSVVGLVRDQKALEKKSATRIQATYRRFRTRRFYLDVMEGIRRRKVRMERKVQEEQATVKLQAACRRYLTQSFYLELVEGIKRSKQQLVKNTNKDVMTTRKRSEWIEETVHDTVLEEAVYDEIIDDGDGIDAVEVVEEIILEEDLVDSTDFDDQEHQEEIAARDHYDDDDVAEYAEISDYEDASYVEISDDEEYETEEEMIEESVEETSLTLLDTNSESKIPPSDKERPTEQYPPSESTSFEKSSTKRGIRTPAVRLADRMKMFNSPQKSEDVSSHPVVKRSWKKPIAKIDLDDDSAERHTSDRKMATRVGNPFVINSKSFTKTPEQTNTPGQRGGLSQTSWTEDNSKSSASPKAPLINRPKKIWKKPEQSDDAATPSVFATGQKSTTGAKKGWNEQINIVTDVEDSNDNTFTAKTKTNPAAVATSTMDGKTHETNDVVDASRKPKRSYQSDLLKKKMIMVEKMINACEDAKKMEKLKKKRVSYLQALAENAGEVCDEKQPDEVSTLDSSSTKVGGTKAVGKLVRNIDTADVGSKEDSLTSRSMPARTEDVAPDNKNQDEPGIADATSPRKKVIRKMTIQRAESDGSTFFPGVKLETAGSSSNLPVSGLNKPIEKPLKDDKTESLAISVNKDTNSWSFQSPFKKTSGNVNLPQKVSMKKKDENDKNEECARSNTYSSTKTTIGGDATTKPIVTDEANKLSAASSSSWRNLSPARPKPGKLVTPSSSFHSPVKKLDGGEQVKRSVATSSSFLSPLKKKVVTGEEVSDTIPDGFQSPMKLKSNISGEVQSRTTVYNKGVGETASAPTFQSPTVKKIVGPAGFRSPLKKTISGALVDNNSISGSNIVFTSTINDKASMKLSPQKAKSTNFVVPSSPRKFKSSGNIESVMSPVVKKTVGVKKVVSQTTPTEQSEESTRPPLPKTATGMNKSESGDTSSTTATTTGGTSGQQQYYNLKDFEEKRALGVDMNNWEQFLTDDEFRKYFEMSKEEFGSQPKWQREKQRRKIRVGF